MYTTWTERLHPPKSGCRNPPVPSDRLGGGPLGSDGVTRVKAQGQDSCPSRVPGEGAPSLSSTVGGHRGLARKSWGRAQGGAEAADSKGSCSPQTGLREAHRKAPLGVGGQRPCSPELPLDTSCTPPCLTRILGPRTKSGCLVISVSRSCSLQHLSVRPRGRR